MNDTSAELLARWREGDQQAAGEIVDRYAQRLVALARSRLSPRLAGRVDAEDVVQSACRSFFVRARQGEFELRHSGDLWRLLAAITARKVLGQVKRHTAARRDVGRESAAGPAGDVAAVVLDRQPQAEEVTALIEELQGVMERLAVDQRRILSLRLQQHDIGEIAETVGRSERTVRRVLAAIRRQLEARLERHEP